MSKASHSASKTVSEVEVSDVEDDQSNDEYSEESLPMFSDTRETGYSDVESHEVQTDKTKARLKWY